MGSFVDARMAFSEGRFDEAVRGCREVLLASPSNLDARLMLGAALVQSGETQAGIDSLEELSREEPDLFEPYLWLTNAYRKLAEVEKAVRTAKIATDLRPFDANARNALGLAQRDQGRLRDAEASFRKSIECDPRMAIAKLNLGATLNRMGRTSEATQVFNQAIETASRSADHLVSVGRFLIDERQFADAEKCGSQAVGLNPSRADAHRIWGQALTELGQIEQARAELERAIELAPTDASAHTLLGSLLVRIGETAKADTAFRRSLSVLSKQGHGALGLSQIVRFSKDELDVVEGWKALANEGSLPIGEQESLHFALGKALEDLGEYEEAMRHFDAGNTLARQTRLGSRPFDRRSFAAGLAATRNIFSKDLFDANQGLGNPSNRPIFIVGMVRTGTTLVEQIVSSHPDVSAAGEVEFWASDGAQKAISNSRQIEWPVLQKLTDEYLDLLDTLAPGSHKVTDKMPANLLALGLIHVTLPNARVLLMRRHAIDTCLSIYTTANRAPVEFYHDKSNIAFAYREFAKLADHWRSVLPSNRLMTVDYESLVAHPETVIPEIIRFCDLPWDDRCLRPQENRRIVSTPSAAQVRQPIHGGSIDRWRRFEPWLSEFGDLEGV